MAQLQDKRSFLFRLVDPLIRNQLRFDDEAMYSTTDQLTANKLAKCLLRVVPPTATVTDANACIGGATYALARIFAKVHAIEIDRHRFEYLRHNMILLGCTSKVQCHHGDALELCPQLAHDVLFLDPPWGGPEYKNNPAVSLYLSGRELSEVCISLAPHARFLAMKVPVNFDTTRFLEKTHAHWNFCFLETNLRKMHLLVLSSSRLET